MINQIKLRISKFVNLILLLISFPVIIFIRIISPICLIRFGYLISNRIGHFAGNTELYLCEKDEKINTPNHPFYFDIFFLNSDQICNLQLAKMWKRKILIFPRRIIQPMYLANKIIPGATRHEILQPTQEDRDVHNLMSKCAPHINFSKSEEEFGEKQLLKMGIQKNSKFVCLIVRDSAYVDKLTNTNNDYHNYRDCDIQYYNLAAEYLSNQGYYVIRMGAIVKNKLISNNIKIIDYATNGMRSDFMDIYLGAKCYFCISSSLGWDGIPEIFRRPIVYTNILPIGYLRTYNSFYLNLSKHHINKQTRIELTLNEIFEMKVDSILDSKGFYEKNIELIENTPDEILDVVVEMNERLNGQWQDDDESKILQTKFWQIFKSQNLNFNNKPLHGEIKAKYSSSYLKNNPNWLQ